MSGAQIRFSDGASYDLLMGEWSRSVGALFLDWLQPAAGLAWLDVGCGSGAFSSLVVERCAPKSLLGIDPSAGQLEFARRRGLGPAARFETGDAMQINLDDAAVDVAVAALVTQFMPDPGRGVNEMTRVVSPGGLVAAYTWDLAGGGFPYEAVHRALRDCGLAVPNPPHPEAGSADELARLWSAAGLADIDGREVSVSRSFRDFDDYWGIARTSPRIAMVLGELTPQRLVEVQDTTRAYVPAPPVLTARANAIRGRAGASLSAAR